ncbi:hypothetical protein PYCCODRAFT_1471755 [Trametes coccinea BRFM310]|uniref:DUF6533 domain-containing protein n=1 Tax=Trametes coccinea (strain BRFM310) TaxID=1353009 RepID=A0A1Y2IA40_TRAC3|nr:hypothetical protein PYCCODRAFT_1471755 [Trametes coccinea BRFM310]
MSDDSTYEQGIVADYPRLLVENYCIIASSALLWFDFALMFTTEYRRIWKRKWTGATLVYLLTRYVAVIERIFFVLEVLVRLCGGITHTDDVLLFLNYLAFSAFTCLRIYGVWGRDWKPLLFVLPLTLVKPIAGIIEVAHYTPVQAGPPYGCIYIYHVPDSVISTPHPYLLSLVSITSKATTIAADAILIGLTWIKTFGIKRDALHTGMRTPLATLLLRDGTAYFLILLLVQVITIISNRIGSKLTIWLVWPYFDQVLTVIFLSRFMLDLRGLYFADRGDTENETSLHLSDVKFQGITSGVVGNFGATLDTTLAFDVPGPDSPLTEDSDTASYQEVRFHWEWDDDEPAYCNDPFVAGMKAQAAEEELAMQKLEKQQNMSPLSERAEEGVENPLEARRNSIHDLTREDISPV